MDLISQDFPNRKGAVGVGNVNVQVVVKLAKDLSAGFQFGAMNDYKVMIMMSLMIIIMMTMMSFPIISQVSQLSHAWYYQTWQCVDGQHERGQEGKGQGSHWDPGVTRQLLHGVKERRGVEQRLAETFSSEIYSESQWSYCLWRRLNNLEVACIYVWVVCLLTDVDLLILRWKFLLNFAPYLLLFICDFRVR